MTYQIRVQGHLDRQWADWFGDLAITHAANGDSILVCQVQDQAALHGLLNQIFALNVTLISVARQERRWHPHDHGPSSPLLLR
jgi:hypothetical protein